jgi:hypothetical protein
MSDRLDSKQAAESYAKIKRGVSLTVREQQALKRFEKDREEQLRWKYYAAIPQKHWRTMSGRQTKVLQEQADRYGIPFGGPTIDLARVARALHDFLAANAHKLAVDDPLLQGESSDALEDYRRERALLARLDRLERERELLPRDQVRQSLARIAAILRGAGDTLQRECGNEAHAIFTEALGDAEAEMDASFRDEATDREVLSGSDDAPAAV